MLTLRAILFATAAELDMSPRAIVARSWASSPESKARQIAMWVYYLHHPKNYGAPLADFFSREISTVFHNVRRMRTLVKQDPKLARCVKNIKKRL